MGANIRYLEDYEKVRSRKLWEEAFFEDSGKFCDYYFKEKTRDNRILVKEEDGEIVSMIHLNPYLVRVRDRVYPLDYIVGVATKKDRRHEGHMRSLLIKMMKDMYKENVPFTFLMPASEKIYAPFDFRFMFSQPVYLSDGLAYPAYSAKAGWTEGRDEEAEELGMWMNGWLKERFQVYALRNQEYVKRLDRELASENGNWTFYLSEKAGFDPRQGETNSNPAFIKENAKEIIKKIAALRCEWGLEKREQRLLYGENCPIADEKPAIMGRIIRLEEFVKNICLKEECPKEKVEAAIKVEDGFLEENSGLWRWVLDKRGSRLERLKETDNVKPDGEFSIGEMIEWLSGFVPAEGDGWMEWVQPLQGIFFDEIV